SISARGQGVEGRSGALVVIVPDLLVEHQGIVVGIEEGEQTDHVGNVADRPVLPDAGRVERGLAGVDVGDAESERGAAFATGILALAEPDIDALDPGRKLAPGHVRDPVEQGKAEHALVPGNAPVQIGHPHRAGQPAIIVDRHLALPNRLKFYFYIAYTFRRW